MNNEKVKDVWIVEKRKLWGWVGGGGSHDKYGFFAEKRILIVYQFYNLMFPPLITVAVTMLLSP